MSDLLNKLKNTLPARIRLVRTSYGIPITEATFVCQDVRQSTFTAWEAGKRMPTIDGLYDFAVSFGVSLDWLCGVSREPYDPEFVLYAENNIGIDSSFLPLFIQNQIAIYKTKYTNDAMERAKAYADTELRVRTFTPNARANLLVFRRYAKVMMDRTTLVDIKESLRQKMFSRIQSYRQSVNMILLTGEASCTIPKDEAF